MNEEKLHSRLFTFSSSHPKDYNFSKKSVPTDVDQVPSPRLIILYTYLDNLTKIYRALRVRW
jgi:hypothetical protein